MTNRQVVEILQSIRVYTPAEEEAIAKAIKAVKYYESEFHEDALNELKELASKCDAILYENFLRKLYGDDAPLPDKYYDCGEISITKNSDTYIESKISENLKNKGETQK